MPEAVIVSTARSPIGRAGKGSLKSLRADDLTVQMVHAALAQVPELNPREISDLILGCGMPGGEQGFNLGRIVSVLSGYDHLPGTTVTRYCSSSLQSTRMAFHAIRAGEGDAFISAGVEMVSRFDKGSSDYIPGRDDLQNPLFEDAVARTGERAQEGAGSWTDPREAGALPDVYVAMGQTAENVAQLTGITRSEQDAFAARSQNLAEKAVADGFWAQDITPVELPDGTVVDRDDCPRPGTTTEVLAGLKPVFRPDGTVTAGNACPLNDGAAALVVMSDVRARELGITPLARILSTAVTGLSPEIMGLGPVEAIPLALKNAGIALADVDRFEINEAFAVQCLGSAQKLGIDVDRLNVKGGAIAVGHPFGMTGARISSTLINVLRADDQQIGVESMCVGGGMGMAMVIERLS
ncbi:acetyl-CoA C-acetyltransferase [Kineosporia sp. NBRC 101731]|uniref:acetyl-CoA C-acetyltransferase n=1 Tax=Kineosporia sp. NBRC 101731 TaxID=3032199 RepID=UPI0024A2854B|nr:acetyl-CoA C-acetyltransferase [Kineosporia sp. NBRC 101731]GLY29182.1 acetyl-CoA acetyltransferase [Kineosporia sp. NBRC 101731]